MNLLSAVYAIAYCEEYIYSIHLIGYCPDFGRHPIVIFPHLPMLIIWRKFLDKMNEDCAFSNMFSIERHILPQLQNAT